MAPRTANASNAASYLSIMAVAAPINRPNDDHPIAIPDIRGSVARNPNLDPWAAQSTLLGPGVKHIGTMNTSDARRSSRSIISSCHLNHHLLGRVQSRVNVLPEILDIFDAYTHSDKTRYDPCFVPNLLWDKHVA